MFSLDTPAENGDHENIYNMSIYDFNDGLKYKNCDKKALMVRSQGEHIPWYNIKHNTGFILLFSQKRKNPFQTVDIDHLPGAYKETEVIKYTRVLHPDHG